MNQLLCKCVRCNNLYPETHYPYNRQESCLCAQCVDNLIKEYLQYTNLQKEDIVYICKSKIKNHKKYFEVIKAKLYDINLTNHWLAFNLYYPTTNTEDNDKLRTLTVERYNNFNISKMCTLFNITLRDLNTKTYYYRCGTEIFKNEQDAQQYCSKQNKAIEFRRNQRMFKNYLYVDDIRQIPKELYNSYKCFQAFSYKQAITKLKKTKFSIIDLDHDLGEEKTGYDICKYIVENNIRFDKIKIHTSNTVGRDNMIQLLHRYTNIPIEVY